MNVTLQAERLRAVWRLHDACRLDQWCDGRPWELQGAVFAAVVPDSLQGASEILEQIARTIRHHASGYRLTRLCPPPTTEASVYECLAHWAQVPFNGMRDLAGIIGRSLNASARIFLCPATNSLQRVLWHEQCVVLSELCSKIAGEAFCAVITSPPDSLTHANVARFDLAWPVDAAPASSEYERWNSYVMERIAWHCGGAIDHAKALALSLSRVSMGDDAAIEKLFDHDACRAYALMPAEWRQRVETLPLRCAADSTLCLAPGLLGAASAPQLIPWIARATLHQIPLHPQRRALRASVICRPLAMRLLGRCLILEAHVKDRVLKNACDTVPIPDSCAQDTIVAFERVIGVRKGLEQDLVPVGHPMPEHPWELATLGTLQYHFPSCPESVDRLRRIRNAIAHGVPVGWAAAKMIDRLEQELIPR